MHALAKTAASNVAPGDIGPNSAWWGQFGTVATVNEQLFNEGCCSNYCCLSRCFGAPAACGCLALPRYEEDGGIAECLVPDAAAAAGVGLMPAKLAACRKHQLGHLMLAHDSEISCRQTEIAARAHELRLGTRLTAAAR